MVVSIDRMSIDLSNKTQFVITKDRVIVIAEDAVSAYTLTEFEEVLKDARKQIPKSDDRQV